ncbi:MAG: ZinT/AdcA family metal-binding protein [Tissierellia bacterium]|nr:ZinT/AdcA family metal-binding protein [Tissierellia bacterium]
MKRSKLLVLLMLMLCGAMIFTACGNKNEPTKEPAEEKPAEKPAEEVVDEVELADWEGSWNNMGAYLDDPELQEAFEILAKNEDMSVEEAKAAYVEKRHCDFDGLVIDKDSITFLDGFPDDGGNEIEKVNYKFTESISVKHGNFDISWSVFEAEGDAKYPVMLLMEVHGEEALTHFHMRYGDDKDALLEKEGWYPTFVKPNSTYDQLTEEITE